MMVRIFEFVFWMKGLGLKPCILQRFRRIFSCEKNALSGPSVAPPDTKAELWCESGDDFRGFVFEPQKCPRQLKVPVKMASSPPVPVPDSTHHTHPFAHTLKRFVNLKPPR